VNRSKRPAVTGAPLKNSGATVPRHMSVHSGAAAKLVQLRMLPKTRTVGTAQTKMRPGAPVYRPQTVPRVLQKNPLPGPRVDRAAQMMPSVPVIQRALNNQVDGRNVLKTVLESASARRELDLSDLSNLRGVNKATRKQVDQSFVNPGGWAVLHRLKGNSFARFMSTSLPNQFVYETKDMFEKTSSKYDPFKYGNDHTWEGNVKWLDEINQKFSRIAVVALPLSKTNLERQTGVKQDQFSAYARELAYVFLNDFRSSQKQEPFTYGQMTTHTLEKPATPIALTENQRRILQAVLDNRRQSVSVAEAMRTFAELGMPINAQELEGSLN
jgi:hypothetical protein